MSGFIPAKPSSLRLAQCTSAGLGLPAPESWKVELAKEQEQMSFYPHGFALYEFSPEGGLYLGRRRVGMTHGRLYADVHDVWCTESPAGGWGISEIERGRYDGVKGAFEYTNVYWVALDTLWEIVREGKRLEPWVEGAVKQLSKVKADLVPQDVLGLFEFAVHGGDTPDSITLFPELGQDGEEQPDVIRDHSGHGNDLMVKPGTPQSVSETDEIFGSPTRCCECDAPQAYQALRSALLYPAFFCNQCGPRPLTGDPVRYLKDAVGAAESLKRVADVVRKLRAVRAAPALEGPAFALTSGVQPRYPRPSKLAPVFKFYGWVGALDIYTDVDEFFTPRRPKCEAPPRGFLASVSFDLGENGTPLFTQLRGICDLVDVANNRTSLQPVAVDMVQRLGGRDKLQVEIDREVAHEDRRVEVCAGCGKPSAVWLDDDETVRCCIECDGLIPPTKNDVISSADDAVGWVKRLRDPYARHTLWEQRVRVWDGTMALELLDPKGKEHADSVWQSQTQAFARMTRALDEELHAQHRREFKPLRTDADVRKANERLRLLLSGDLVGRRLR